MNIVFLGDLLDQRAKKSAEQTNWLDVAKVLIPATLGTALNLSDTITKILTSIPIIGIYLQALIPVGLFALCIYAIIARERISEQSPGFNISKKEKAYYQYKFAQATRITAKTVFIPLMFISAVNLKDYILPNWITGQKFISGKVIDKYNQVPASGIVEVLDISKRIISKKPELLDDSGFFYSDLKNWSKKPFYIKIISSPCKTDLIEINQGITQNNTTSEIFVWQINCY